MKTDRTEKTGNIPGIVCTVLGGALALWVVARLASFAGLQQTWAPPLLLIVGLVRWTRAAPGGAATRPEPRDTDARSRR